MNEQRYAVIFAVIVLGVVVAGSLILMLLSFLENRGW